MSVRIRTGGRRVLIVDDDMLDRMAVRRAFSAFDQSISVFEAESVSAGLAAARSQQFDCVVLDFYLPDGSGLDLLAHLRSSGSQVPVIVLTGRGDAEIAVELMKSGATDYLAKAALSPDRLGQSLRYALRIRESDEQVQRYAAQMQALADAALRIAAMRSIEVMLQFIAAEAASMIGVRYASVLLYRPGGESVVHTVGALDEADADAEQLDAALIPRDGPPIGELRVAGKLLGEFIESDFAILTQLAQLAAGAMENVRLLESARASARARDDMLAVVSHDLRNPLHAIEMASTALDMVLSPETADNNGTGPVSPQAASPASSSVAAPTVTTGTQPIVQRQLGVLRRAASQANRLIADLMDATRIDSGSFLVTAAPMEASTLVRDALDMLAPLAASANVELFADIQSDGTRAAADGERVLQVFSNLGGNAVKFTARGGKITLGSVVDGDFIRMTVRDTGEGIDGDHLPHVFTRSFQAERTARHGAGLGLWIAKGIVEAHGGRIGIDSTVGAGTEVWFTLPLAE